MIRIRPTFSITNKRLEPSGCKSTGRTRPEMGNCCHVYALGSGSVVGLPGVAVGAIGLAAGVSEIVVGGRDVSVREATVGVPEGGAEVGVLVPLHAATDNTSKSMSRLIYSIICRLHPSHQRPQYLPNYLPDCFQDSAYALVRHSEGKVQRTNLNQSKGLLHHPAHRCLGFP